LNTVLRFIQADDAATIARMLHDLAAQTGVTLTPRVDENHIRQFGPGGKAHFDGLLAEQSGKAVGICLFSTTFSGWRGASGLFISDLFIEPELRGQGLGQRLLAAVCTHAKQIGCHYLRLDVDPQNHPARAFYRKQGFAEHKDEMPLFLEQAGMQALMEQSPLLNQ